MQKMILLFTVVQMLFLGAISLAAETKDIRFTFKNADPVVFSHEVHLGKYNKKCKYYKKINLSHS